MSDRLDREMKCIDSIHKNMTLKKAIGMADALRDGTRHPVKGEIECAVGYVKRCKQRHVEHIVHYNDIMAHKRNVSTTCRICDSEPIPACIDTKENRQIHRSMELIDRILKASPPKNDGILELDRIAYIYNVMSVSAGSDISIDDARADVFDLFMLDCAQRGLIADES